MAKLEFVTQLPKAARVARAAVDPKIRMRNKFIDGVETQINLASNPEYTIPVRKRVGGKMEVVGQRSPRAWWKIVDDKVYVPIKYGQRDLPIQGGNIAVTTQNNLLATLNTIKEMGENGEFDNAIKKVASTMGRGKKKAA